MHYRESICIRCHILYISGTQIRLDYQYIADRNVIRNYLWCPRCVSCLEFCIYVSRFPRAIKDVELDWFALRWLNYVSSDIIPGCVYINRPRSDSITDIRAMLNYICNFIIQCVRSNLLFSQSLYIVIQSENRCFLKSNLMLYIAVMFSIANKKKAYFYRFEVFQQTFLWKPFECWSKRNELLVTVGLVVVNT